MSSLSVTEARSVLPELLDRVIAGEEVTITRHGREVAVLVRPDTLRVRRADATLAESERLRDILERGRRSRLRDLPDIGADRAEQMVADLAARRSDR